MTLSSAKRPRAVKKRPSVARAKAIRRTRASLEPQSLLILHLDAEKLRHDGLHLGAIAEFSGRIASFTVGSEVVLAEASTQGELNELFAGFAKEKRTFDVIVVVGHSSERVIRIDQHTPPMLWSGFAEYLKPLMPRRLLLVACKGGRWDAGETLFRAIPRLRRIFACPVNASKAFGALMLFAVPYVCATRAPKDKHVLLSHLMAIGATGRQLREWRRTTDKGNPDSAVFDFIADIADPVARKVPEILSTLLGGRRSR